jgi:hypothetical protein
MAVTPGIALRSRMQLQTPSSDHNPLGGRPACAIACNSVRTAGTFDRSTALCNGPQGLEITMNTPLARLAVIPVALALFLMAVQSSGGFVWRADHPEIVAMR